MHWHKCTIGVACEGFRRVKTASGFLVGAAIASLVAWRDSASQRKQCRGAALRPVVKSRRGHYVRNVRSTPGQRKTTNGERQSHLGNPPQNA